jgi:hypothetical protein
MKAPATLHSPPALASADAKTIAAREVIFEGRQVLQILMIWSELATRDPVAARCCAEEIYSTSQRLARLITKLDTLVNTDPL